MTAFETNDLQLALKLLLVGMSTVFVVLALVVLTAKALIRVVNSYTHATPKAYGQAMVADTKTAVKPQQVAAIAAVVAHLTNGQGTIEQIKPIHKN